MSAGGYGGSGGASGAGGSVGGTSSPTDPGHVGEDGLSGGGGGGGGGGSGSTGGKGGDGSSSGSGTAGTGGLGGSSSGADGGSGTEGSGGSGGGGGGGGAVLIEFTASGASTGLFHTYAGGNGGNGGMAADGGSGGGGAGADAFVFSGGHGDRLYIAATASFLGGNGGYGGAIYTDGSRGYSSSGGDGGDAIFGGDTNAIVNRGKIIGGNGGAAGTDTADAGRIGHAGAGGTGIVGSNLSITNFGLIAGGLSGDGSAQADAITFTSGSSNNLALNGGSIDGAIGISGVLTITTGRDFSLTSVIHDGANGSGSVDFNGTHTLTLAAANSFSHGLSINGTVDLNHATNGMIDAGGTGTIVDNASLELGASGTLSNDLIAEQGSPSITAVSGVTTTLAGKFSAIDPNGIIFGSTSDQGTIVFAPVGTVSDFAGENPTIEIAGGTLRDGNGTLSSLTALAVSAHPVTTQIDSGATLDLNGFVDTIDTLTGSGTLTNATGGFSVILGGTFDGAITGAGSIEFSSESDAVHTTTTLTHASTITGGVVIDASTTLDLSTFLSSLTAASLRNNGTLEMAGGSQLNATSPIVNDGVLLGIGNSGFANVEFLFTNQADGLINAEGGQLGFSAGLTNHGVIEGLITTNGVGVSVNPDTGSVTHFTGGDGNNTIRGTAGIDQMAGGAGNDAYTVNNAGDTVLEATTNAGTDTVFATLSYTLGAGQSIDYLATTSRTGTGAINLTGNGLDQRIDGNYGNNVLRDGGSDSHGDTLYGFLGNDTFYVSNAADKVFEAVSDAGSDTVFTSVSYALQSGQSVEYLATTSRLGTGTITLTGNEQAQRIDGNYGVNGLYGGDGNDTLYGFDGNDRLGGGNGRDLMDGGNGNDIFTYSAVIQSTGVNRDLIQNMNFAQDKFDLPAIPTGIDTKVIVGTLNETSFDTNLVSAIGAGQLAAHHAVLFDPSAGTDNIAGHIFLIVDVNGVAGYQAGADYVIELQSATGSLTLGDFS